GKGGEFLQPKEITLLANLLADIPQNSSVFNPFAGLASFALNLDPSINYSGQEINKKTWAIGALRLLAYNRTAGSYDLKDSFSEWPEEEKFDLVISSPPMGMKLNKKIEVQSSGYGTAEEFFIGKGLGNLNTGGKLISVISNG